MRSADIQVDARQTHGYPERFSKLCRHARREAEQGGAGREIEHSPRLCELSLRMSSALRDNAETAEGARGRHALLWQGICGV